jgi:hypothetical protein
VKLIELENQVESVETQNAVIEIIDSAIALLRSLEQESAEDQE